jgi:hypothetical protein
MNNMDNTISTQNRSIGLGWVSKLYTIALMLLPALNVYQSPIPSIELGTFIVLLCAVFFICVKQGFNRPGADRLWFYLLFVFFIGTITSSIILNYDSTTSRTVFFRFAKIVAIVLTLFVIGRDQFNYRLAIKTLRCFSIFCALFIIFQYIFFYIFSQTIPGVYAPLASAEGFAEYDFDRMYHILFRPSALFFEPSHFAAYEFVYFSYLLSHTDEKLRNLKLGLIFAGILLSTSGTGFVVLPILIMFSLFLRYRNGNLNASGILRIAVILILLGIMVYLFFNTSFGLESLQRQINRDGTLGGSATGRLQSGAFELFKDLPSALQFFGCGFGNRPDTVYFPSVFALLYGDGYLGTGLFVIMMYVYFKRANDFGKMLCLAYIILFMGTGVFNFASIGLYFSLISANSKRLRV